MPLFITISITKLVLKMSRLLGRGGGSALPGLIAEKLDPGIGRKLASGIRGGSIIVTGTNGKTTTSKMIARILSDSGEKLVQNRAGSNLSRGVVSALIEHASITGKIREDIGLFEVDEAAMPAVSRMVQPRKIVVLNLFRDQLDRYGELDTTAKLIGKGIAAAPNAQVYLNADDPLVASLATYSHGEVSFFGLDDVPIKKLDSDATADSDNCPICGRALEYSKSFYGHIGHYKCVEGHFDRPEPTIVGAGIKLAENGAEFTTTTGNDASNHRINLPGVYNVYNALAAVVIADGLGIPGDSVAVSLERVEAAFGRVEQLKVGDKELYLLLVKNPTGFNQVIQSFMLRKAQQHCLIIINDNFADGRDVSWLWDVSFEELKDQKHTIDVAGIRATDMALRLKYESITVKEVTSDISEAVNKFLEQLPAGETGYIIPTYTAMLEARKLLGKRTKLAGVWE